MKTITGLSIRQFSSHVSSQNHAMAGATIAASAALACSLGLACVRINIPRQEDEARRAFVAQTADRLDAIRQRLLRLADDDGAAIAEFAALRDAGRALKGQELLCQLPVDMGRLSIEAADLLQEARPFLYQQQDDLEMAIRLLDGAARAAILLLDSNLRIWPEPDLLERFEPLLLELNALAKVIQPVDGIRTWPSPTPKQ